MNIPLRRIPAWLAALMLVIFSAAAVSAQEAEEADKADLPAQEQEEEAVDEDLWGPEDLAISVGAGYDLWVANFDFKSNTRTESLDHEVSSLSGIDLFAAFEVEEGWRVQVDLEALFANETRAIVMGVGAVYYPEVEDDVWRPFVRASLLFGTIDISDVPGDFDAGFGLEVGAGLEYDLAEEVTPGLVARVDVLARHLAFDFDEDDDVLDADDEVGGFGVKIQLGIEYRF